MQNYKKHPFYERKTSKYSYFCRKMIQFKLEGEFIPLIQLLKATGLVGTGGDAQAVVMDGLVKCNGEVEFRKRYKVRIGDIITFEKDKIQVI